MDQGYQDPKEASSRREEVQRWNTRISNAKRWRDDICKKRRWKELIDEYKGKWDFAVDIAVLPINLIFAYVKTELPSLYIRDPHIKINPKNSTSIGTSKVLESVINYIWYYKKIKREIKKAIVDALLIGHAWFKTGYTGQFGTIEDGHGGVIETVESEDFFAYRLPWDCVVFDPDAMDPPHDCEWIAHSVWLPLDEVKQNPRYQNTENLQANYCKKDNYGTGDDINEKYAGKTCLTEVWHIKTKQVFTIAEGVDDYIEEPKAWPYEMRGYPFSFLKFNFSNDDAYGISDVSVFEPQVLELIKARSSGMDHYKRFNRQFLTTPDNISDDEMNKITQGITGSIIKVMDPSKVMPLPYPPLQSDIYALEERIKEDMINISGQSPTERGATQKTSTRTKAELIFQRQGAENRRSEKIDLVEDFVEEIATNLIGLIQQFATEPYYVRILGAKSPELLQALQERSSTQAPGAMTNSGGFTFTAADIEGEFDLEVVSGSSTPVDRTELMKALLQLLELGPKAGAIPGGPLMGAVSKMIIETLDLEEVKVAFQAEFEAQQQMKQEQASKEQEIKSLSLAKQGADSQIEATNAATKQNKVLVDFLKVMHDNQSEDSAADGENEREGMKAKAEVDRQASMMEHQMSLDETKTMHEMGLKEVKTKHEMEMQKMKAMQNPKKDSK